MVVDNETAATLLIPHPSCRRSYTYQHQHQSIPRQVDTAPAALVACPAADHIQVGSLDVQTSEHVHSGLPASPNHMEHVRRTLRSTAIPQPDRSSHSPGQTFPGVLSNFQQSVWNSLPQTVLTGELNTNMTCQQHLFSYDSMALYKFDYYYYYYKQQHQKHTIHTPPISSPSLLLSLDSLRSFPSTNYDPYP